MTQEPITGERAPAGGGIGLTGTWYAGGQYLPASERPNTAQTRAPRTPTQRDLNERAEREAFKARAATIAAELHTVFLTDWLIAAYYHTTYGYWLNTFAQSMHDALTRLGKRPADLTERQYDALADMYAREHGRAGSKKYNAAYDRFVDATLPEDA